MTEKNRTETEDWLTTECPEVKDNSTGQYQLEFFKFLLPIVLIVACVSTAIYYYALKRRRLDQLRHRLVPFYRFEPGDEDEWQTELLDESDNQRSFTRLQDYKSTGSVSAVNQDERSYF